MNKPIFPVWFIGITQEFKLSHLGIDLGWNNNYGGANQNVFSPLDMKIVQNGFDKDAGNMTVGISNYSSTQDIVFRFLHLKELPKLTIGQVLEKFTTFAQMGKTGLATGEHLHFETWIVPKGYTYKYTDKNKYAVNPLSVCYYKKGHVLSSNTSKNYKLMFLEEINETEMLKNKIKELEKELSSFKKIEAYIKQ